MSATLSSPYPRTANRKWLSRLTAPQNPPRACSRARLDEHTPPFSRYQYQLLPLSLWCGLRRFPYPFHLACHQSTHAKTLDDCR